MLDFVDNGRRVQKVVGSGATEEELTVIEEAANREAARLNLALIEGTYAPKKGEMPIDGILAEFLKHVDTSTRRPATKKLYAWQLSRFREFLQTTTARRAKDLTPELIIGFVQSQTDSAPDTVRGSLIALSRCFARACDRGDMQTNPCRHPDVRGVKPQTRRHERFFDDVEFEKVLDAAKVYQGRRKEDMHDYLLLLGESGLRCGEALMLRWCDIRLDESGSYLRVTPHDGWSPKTKTSIRRVPLSERVEDMLRRRLRDVGLNPTAKVFPEPFSYREAAWHFHCILKLIGLDGEDPETGQRLRLHSLRHTFASKVVRSGATANEVRDLCGHGSVMMTDRYMQTPASSLFGAVSRAFDPRHKNESQSGRIQTFSAAQRGDAASGAKG
jgi:integrase